MEILLALNASLGKNYVATRGKKAWRKNTVIIRTEVGRNDKIATHDKRMPRLGPKSINENCSRDTRYSNLDLNI